MDGLSFLPRDVRFFISSSFRFVREEKHHEVSASIGFAPILNVSKACILFMAFIGLKLDTLITP